MYNLLVSSDAQAWHGEPFLLELERCVREYTDTHLVDRFRQLNPEDIVFLTRLPCVFAYEVANRKNPRFGVIRDVIMRQGKAKIEYEIIPLEHFISASDLTDLAFDLDISRWELNRTHWAVKDIDLAKELHRKGIALPAWSRMTTKTVDITLHHFDVALSFPGEVRQYVSSVAAELEQRLGPNSYFYDDNYVSQLARPSLDVLLQAIYRDRSKLIVVFLCSDYQNKEWCGVEFRAIRDIIKQRQGNRIMFVRMDDGAVEGVFQTDGYVDARRYRPGEVAHLIQERVDLLKRA